MHTDRHIGETPPPEDARQANSNPNQGNKQELSSPATQHTHRTPAKLPAHSQAALAQHLNDVPERIVPRHADSPPQRPTHPLGWRMKRHFKRKNLRQKMEKIN